MTLHYDSCMALLGMRAHNWSTSALSNGLPRLIKLSMFCTLWQCYLYSVLCSLSSSQLLIQYTSLLLSCLNRLIPNLFTPTYPSLIPNKVLLNAYSEYLCWMFFLNSFCDNDLHWCPHNLWIVWYWMFLKRLLYNISKY